MSVHRQLLQHVRFAPDGEAVEPAQTEPDELPGRVTRLAEVQQALDHLLKDMRADDRRQTLALLAESTAKRWEDLDSPPPDL